MATGRSWGRTPAPPPAAAPAASRTIVGEIVSIDLGTKTIVIRDSVKTSAPRAKRETVTLSLEPTTSLVRGKKPVALEELRPKDHVVARYLVSPTGAKAISLRVADRVVRVLATQGSSAAVSTPSNTADSGGD